MDAERRGYLELILFSLFIGIMGVIVKLVQNLGVYSIVFFRALIASLFILGVVIARRRLKELVLIDPTLTFLTGIFQGVSIALYFGSIVQTSVSNAIFLLYTAPIFSIIFARVFFHEKIEKRTIYGMILTIAGVIFILDSALGLTPQLAVV